MYGTWRTSSMILRLCSAPTTAWDIRNLRRCGNPLNALEIIPSSSVRCRSPLFIRKDFARRMNRWFEFCWAAASGTV